MLPGGWNFTNHMQCNINFCVLLQDDMLSVRWLVFPNRTIPLGRKLTLNMHFSYTLPGSCSLFSLSVSFIYFLHLPSSSFSLIVVSHFHLSYSYCPCFASLLFFPSSILPLSPDFPILYFPFFLLPYFSILPVLLTSSPVPFPTACTQKIMFLVMFCGHRAIRRVSQPIWKTQPVSPREPSASHAIL